MRIKRATRWIAVAATVTMASVIGVTGAAQAAPHDAAAAAATESNQPVSTTVAFNTHGYAYHGGTEGVTPEVAEYWCLNYVPLEVTVEPAHADGTIHYEAREGGETIDMGHVRVVDGMTSTDPSVLPGGPVNWEEPSSGMRWYELSATFVPDDPAEFSASAPDTWLWVQAGNYLDVLDREDYRTC